MNPELIQVLLQLQERSLKFGSPLLQLAFERLVPGEQPEGSQAGSGAVGSEAWRTSPGLLDALRSQQLIVEEVTRIHRLLLQLVAESRPGAKPPAPQEPHVSIDRVAESPAVLEPESRQTIETESSALPKSEDDVDSASDARNILKQAERLLLLHPMAAQAAFSALVAQGRRFATTAEGQALAKGLSGAPILGKLRRIWETTTLNMLEEQATTVLPNMYVEAIFRAARSANLEEMLSQPGSSGKER